MTRACHDKGQGDGGGGEGGLHGGAVGESGVAVGAAERGEVFEVGREHLLGGLQSCTHEAEAKGKAGPGEDIGMGLDDTHRVHRWVVGRSEFAAAWKAWKVRRSVRENENISH